MPTGKSEDINNYIGKIFCMLTVISDAGRDKNGRYIMAKCECGSIRKYRISHVKYGKIVSCGCYAAKNARDRKTTHGLSKHPLHSILNAMKSRCYNSNTEKYHRWGGRGITICEEWLNSFKSFYDWSIQNGYAKGLQIDRIDNDGNYEPSNCRWVPRKVNARNTRTNKFIEYNGELKTIAEWCEIVGISQKRYYSRTRRGWSVQKTLSTPLIVK